MAMHRIGRLGLVVLAMAGMLLGGVGPLLATPPGQDGPPSRFEVGEPFPELTLPALADGRPSSIRDFRGQKIILHVFASW